MTRKDWALSALDKMDARAALALLKGSGLTLESAARMALDRSMRPEASKPLSEAIAGFLTQGRARGLRSRTLEWYGGELAGFADVIGEKSLDAITRREIVAFLDGRGAGVRPASWRCVRALFRFALAQEPPWIAVDPTRGMKVARPMRDHAVTVLSVAQCKTLLNAAGDYRAAVAVALFAGLRPEEIAGRDKQWLTWTAITACVEAMTSMPDIPPVKIPASKTKPEVSKKVSKKDGSQLAASGSGSQLAASGYDSKLAASGYDSQLAASGSAVLRCFADFG